MDSGGDAGHVAVAPLGGDEEALVDGVHPLHRAVVLRADVPELARGVGLARWDAPVADELREAHAPGLLAHAVGGHQRHAQPFAVDEAVPGRHREGADEDAAVLEDPDDGVLEQVELGEGIGAALDDHVVVADLLGRVGEELRQRGAVVVSESPRPDGAVGEALVVGQAGQDLLQRWAVV